MPSHVGSERASVQQLVGETELSAMGNMRRRSHTVQTVVSVEGDKT